MQKISLFGVKVHTLNLPDFIAHLVQTILSGQRALVYHVNVHGLNLAWEHAWYRDCLNQADFVYCDGMGVQLAARLLYGLQMPRYTLPDWIDPLADVANREGLSFFFLGSQPGVAERAARRLMQQHPGLRVVGVHHGYFQKEVTHTENQAVLAEINSTSPDILIVGFGMPIQEKWLMENWENMGVKVAIAGGAIFEYISGDLRRGSKWMTNNYLEWMAKLVISPRRYALRYAMDLPKFAWRVLQQKMGARNLDEALPRKG